MKKIMALALAAVMLLCASTVLAETVDYEIGTDKGFKPFEYTDENGVLVGIDVEILAAIAEDQGFTYNITDLGWDASIAACQAGQMDGMIAGASITDERKESGWVFSDGYFTATQSMAIAAGSNITGFADLTGHSVAVKIGTMSKDYADSLSGEYGFKVVTFETSADIYMAVIGGVCAACFDDTPIMADNIKSGVPLQLVEGTENEGAEYGFAVFKSGDGELAANKQELIDKFNAGLANIKANGKYDEIIAKYMGV